MINIQLLENTPSVLQALLLNLEEEKLKTNEGANTWTIKEVVAHLILNEQTNWISRATIILEESPQIFVPIDMKGHFEMAVKKTIAELLHEFAACRKESLQTLADWQLDARKLSKVGVHPVMGLVSLAQLLNTWVTHDLTHLVQIARILAVQNKDAVGPFVQYLSILKPK